MPENTSRALRDYSSLYTPAAIVVAGILIGVGLFLGLSSSTSGSPQYGQQGQELITTKKQMQERLSSNPPQPVVDSPQQGGDIVIGKKDAPLTMTYWFDYQCPFCKQFEVTVMPTLIKDYVNTGKMKIVLKDYPFLGQDSQTAAEYSHAVWDLYPDKFFAWQTAMFDVQDAEGDEGFGDAATIDTLISLISGIDGGKVKAQVAAKKAQYDALIAAELKAGQDAGVQGTPGFRVGKQSIDGAQPLANFRQVIDPQLK